MEKEKIESALEQLRKYQNIGDSPVSSYHGSIVPKITLKEAADTIEFLIAELEKQGFKYAENIHKVINEMEKYKHAYNKLYTEVNYGTYQIHTE